MQPFFSCDSTSIYRKYTFFLLYVYKWSQLTSRRFVRFGRLRSIPLSTQLTFVSRLRLVSTVPNAFVCTLLESVTLSWVTHLLAQLAGSILVNFNALYCLFGVASHAAAVVPRGFRRLGFLSF